MDVSFYSETLDGATGTIARDDRMNFIAATTWFLPYLSAHFVEFFFFELILSS